MSEIINILNEISKKAGALAPEKNGGVPFAFRGVDQVVSHLAPLLKEKGVVVVPEVLDRVTSTREIGNNKAITQTDLLTKFTFYAPDGSSVSATTAGLAQDYADRSAAQSQSVAFRVALLQVFKLPTTDKEPEVAGEETQKYIADQAKEQKAAAAKPAAKARDATTARNELQAIIANSEDYPGYGPEEVNALGGKHSGGKSPQEWMTDVKVLDAILDSVKKGELA
jgi:hypothetical protein